jgi:hypothetical protein
MMKGGQRYKMAKLPKKNLDDIKKIIKDKKEKEEGNAQNQEAKDVPIGPDDFEIKKCNYKMASSTFRCSGSSRISRMEEIKIFLMKPAEAQFSAMIENLGFFHQDQSNTKNFDKLFQQSFK